MNGIIPGLLVDVKGTNEHYYYGDSIRVYFSNSNQQSHHVKVPVGLRLIPDDSDVQIMYTAGGETLIATPGESAYYIKAFCGEMHDWARRSYTTFSPGGFAEGDLMFPWKK